MQEVAEEPRLRPSKELCANAAVGSASPVRKVSMKSLDRIARVSRSFNASSSSQVICSTAAAISGTFSTVPRMHTIAVNSFSVCPHHGWTIKSYPCFEKLGFLHFDLMQSPICDTIIAQTQASSLFLDLGCGLGQDIRRLIGVIITGVHFGRDEVSELWDGVPAGLEKLVLHNPGRLKHLEEAT
ncbi:hypothetical protein ETB97_001571 [Aspergillus alliaceus]|uniref:Uncharacterized protein n=1 Tax=Petromyces alliaceus TaxID=209559 RepID=A0A8H6AGT2_PETAA|nr:hypothetical protein ETB97_001571 [Aspergillus burnettii]